MLGVVANTVLPGRRLLPALLAIVCSCLPHYANPLDARQPTGFSAYLALVQDATSGAGSAAGSLCLADISQCVWEQQSYLKFDAQDASDSFGNGIAISGDTLVVGANNEQSNQGTITNGSTGSTDNSVNGAGAVYVFVRSGSSWSPQAYIKPPHSDVNDRFGGILALDGDTLVVGVASEDSNLTTITNGTTASTDNSNGGSGAVFVYVRSGTTWLQQAYIKAPNNDSNDSFGLSVDISGDTLVVGANGEQSNQTTITNGTTASADNSNALAGAAYVFVRSGSTWSQQAYLKASNHDAGDQFGVGVGVSGDTIVVSATGEQSSQNTITNGATASADNSAGGFTGAAYVFFRSGVTWSQQAYLKPPVVQASDSFGSFVAIDGDTIVVGSAQEDSNHTGVINGATASSDNSATSAGAAWVFARSGSTWSHEAYLKPPNTGGTDGFGVAAISGDRILIGAATEDSAQTTVSNDGTATTDNSSLNSGAAYLFTRSGGLWSNTAYFKAPNNGAGDQFGTAVAISSTTIGVGATMESSAQQTVSNGTTASADDSSAGSGAVYVFESP